MTSVVQQCLLNGTEITPINTLSEFLDSLTADKQQSARFWCLDVPHVPIDTKLNNLKKDLTAEQLEICRRLLEKEGSDFKKFLPKTQHSTVDRMVSEGEFGTIRELIIKTELPAALEAFENYLNFHHIETRNRTLEVQDGNDNGTHELQGPKIVRNESELREGTLRAESNTEHSISNLSLAGSLSKNEASPFPFLQNADPKTIEIVHKTIAMYTERKARVIDVIVGLFLKEKKPEYENWKREMGFSDNVNVEKVLEIAKKTLQSFEEAKESSNAANSPSHGEADTLRDSGIQQTGNNIIGQNDAGDLDRFLENSDGEETNHELSHELRNKILVDTPHSKAAKKPFFSFLEEECDEAIEFVHTTIRASSISSKMKDQHIFNCLSDENRQKYQLFKDGLTKTIALDFKAINRPKSIRLKKLLAVYGSGDFKNKGHKWFCRLNEEDRTLEVAMATINKKLQKSMKEALSKSENDDNNKQLVLYRGKITQNNEPIRKLKMKYNIFKRIWRRMKGAMVGLFRKYFQQRFIRRNRQSTALAIRGSSIF